MSAETRTTLKNYFKSGSLPSEDQFENLIDSMLNMTDEGFEKTAPEGFKVAQLSEEGKLISFFENIPIKSPKWSVKIEKKIDLKSGAPKFKLIFLNDKDKEILTLTPDGKVGIKQINPDFELDVDGTIASQGRIGKKGAKDLTVHANGHWQDITDPLEGCHAFEIMAGVGKPKSGKYALLHAFALNTFNAKGGILNRRRKIVYHQAHYGSRCNRLKLRWQRWEKGPKYTLQLKTGCAYDRAKDGQEAVEKAGKDVGVYVKYYITKLWFDKEMKDCVPKR